MLLVFIAVFIFRLIMGRKSYNAGFKLNVIKYARELGTPFTALKFEVNERTVKQIETGRAEAKVL